MGTKHVGFVLGSGKLGQLAPAREKDQSFLCL